MAKNSGRNGLSLKKRSARRFALEDDTFGPEAQQVCEALERSNPEDRGVMRFAKRTARAITAFEGGFTHAAFPLGAFLLFGSPHSPILEYAQLLSQTWIGSRDDGERSCVYIDCAGIVSARGTTEFSRLTGPPTKYPNYPIAQLPALSEYAVTEADFTIRMGEKERALQKFRQEFLNSQRPLIEQFGGIPVPLHERLEQEFKKIRDEGAPYRSVIVVDNLEFAPPDLLSEIIRPMLNPATLQVLGLQGIEHVSFATSIVILIMHDRWNWMKTQAMPLGFTKPRQPEISDDIYRMVRQNLLEDPRFSGLTNDIGDNLILMGLRTALHQQKEFRERLTRLARTFADNFEIQTTWSDEFLEMLVKESFDPDLGFFTERRSESAFEKCAELPLAKKIIGGGVQRKTAISFVTREDKKTSSVSPVLHIQKGEGKVIVPEEIRTALHTPPQSSRKNTAVKETNPASFEELKKELDQIVNQLTLIFRQQQKI
jgi:hypothetical protein